MSRRGRERDAAMQPRSVARLGAVQALYQIELADKNVDQVIDEFRHHRLGVEIDGITYADVDTELLDELVRGAVARRGEIDRLITQNLTADWSFDRLESVLRAILRGGTFELMALPAIPVRVVIDEYVDIAHAFFSGSEPGFVNGVLDRLGRILRPDEMEANGNERSAEAK